MSTPGDDQPAVGSFGPPHLTHNRLDIARSGNKKHFIICFNNGVALGCYGAVFAKYRRHAGVNSGHVLAQIT